MSKECFRFKQFDVYHQVGFKITTEACIFGAYISKNINAQSIVDIGTGTGLLSLMYAQNNISQITAVEIDADVAKETLKNFSISPFKGLNLVNENVLTWSTSTQEKFDLVITNPPFYKNHLLGKNEYQNSAKHQNNLSLENLAQVSANLLNTNGCVAVLLPVYEQNIFQQLIAKFHLYPYRVLNVFNRDNNNQFRKIVIYTMGNESKEEKLVIYNNDNTYTEAFKELMKDYYMIF